VAKAADNAVAATSKQAYQAAKAVVYKDWAKIGFTYVVYGKTIKRFQKYIVGEGLKKGQTYPVEYLLSNPAVSIIMLE
jgi:hypothetical protein